MRVLIADDDPLYRSLLEELLRKWHFDVVSTSDGLAAEQVMSQPDRPRLAILDWNMPGLDGVEVTKSIRSRDDAKPAYVLMITGTRSKAEMMRVLVSGADDYLIKPFDPMDLQIHVRTGVRLIHLQQELEELRAQPASAEKAGAGDEQREDDVR